LPTDLVAGVGERGPNIFCRHDESVVAKDIALTDLSRELLDVGMEFLLQRSLIVR
jgi:hypothetical protein